MNYYCSFDTKGFCTTHLDYHDYATMNSANTPRWARALWRKLETIEAMLKEDDGN